MSILDLIVKRWIPDVCAYGYFRNQHGIIIEKYRQFKKIRLSNNKLQLSLKSQYKLENITLL